MPQSSFPFKASFFSLSRTVDSTAYLRLAAGDKNSSVGGANRQFKQTGGAKCSHCFPA